MGFAGVGIVPDGKMLSFPADLNEKSEGFVISITPDWIMLSPTSFLEDVIG